MFANGRILTREHQNVLRQMCRRDPSLLTVDQVAVAIALGAKANTGEVGSGHWFTKCNGLESSRGNVRDNLSLLRVVAPSQIGLGCGQSSAVGLDRRQPPRDRLQEHTLVDEASSAASIFSR